MTKIIKKDLMKNSKGELAEKLIFAYHSLEKAEKALTEAKKDGVREFLTKIRDHCRDEAICDGCPLLPIDCNYMSKATDEDIQKVAG